MLDIGCNAGFYSIEMKRRGAEPRARHRQRRALSRAGAAREPRRSASTTSSSRKLDVYDVGALGETFDLVIFMGVLYHLRHPLLALDLIREHVAGDMMLFQSMQRGSKHVLPLEHDYEFEETRHLLRDRLSQAALHRAAIFARLDQLVGARTAPAPRRCCAPPASRIDKRIEEEVYLCRVADRPYREISVRRPSIRRREPLA